MSETHTPLPWEDNGDGWIAGGPTGAWVGCLDHPLDASRAVKAVNAHDELVEALKEVMDWIDNWDPNFTQDDEWPDTAALVKAILAKVQS